MRAAVCDASIVIPWYVNEGWSPTARRLQGGPLELLAPTMLLTEVGNALLARLRRGQPDPSGHPEASLHALRSGIIAFTPDTILLDSALAIAQRLGHPIYDCFYLALCRRAEAMLATFDARLARHATTLAIPLWRPEDA